MKNLILFFLGFALGIAACLILLVPKIRSLVRQEAQISQIQKGLSKNQIAPELLVGARPFKISIDLPECGVQASGLHVNANPSWILGRMEDSIEIYFDSDQNVCHVRRLGL